MPAAFRSSGVTSFSTQVGFRGLVEGIDPTLIKYFIGSWDELRHQRPVLDQGRFPDPTRADEILVIGRGARTAGLDVGDQVSVQFLTSDFSGQVSERFTIVGLGDRGLADGRDDQCHAGARAGCRWPPPSSR